MSLRRYQIGEVAGIAGVSVRTLRHYDAIGLLAPSERSAAGYRLYAMDDLLRLQQIVIGRRMGLPLEAIRRWLDDPEHDRRAALLEQRRELERRARDTDAMLRAVDRALAMLDTEKGDEMTTEDLKELFDGFDPAAHEAEARERWGDTEAYAASAERTKSYGAAEWRAIKEEQEAVYTDAARALEAGKRPEDDEVMDIAERHRLSIDRWFYTCSPAMHAGLADLYEADPRFAENIDKHGAGLTPFLAAAIRANARRGG